MKALDKIITGPMTFTVSIAIFRWVYIVKTKGKIAIGIAAIISLGIFFAAIIIKTVSGTWSAASLQIITLTMLVAVSGMLTICILRKK